jgi:hypothetical protein
MPMVSTSMPTCSRISQAKLQGSKLGKSGKQLANNIIAHLDHHYVRAAAS